MIAWLKSAFEDSAKPGHASIKRIVFFLAGLSLSLSVVILVIAACYGADVDVALATVTAPLATLAGYGYVNGKKVERSTQNAISKD